jgi:hypothetical protein
VLPQQQRLLSRPLPPSLFGASITSVLVAAAHGRCSSIRRRHHHQITKLSHSINAIGPAFVV